MLAEALIPRPPQTLQLQHETSETKSLGRPRDQETSHAAAEKAVEGGLGKRPIKYRCSLTIVAGSNQS